jgi:hypothetical protein
MLETVGVAWNDRQLLHMGRGGTELRSQKRKGKTMQAAGSGKPLPTLIKEKEPFWHRVP